MRRSSKSTKAPRRSSGSSSPGTCWRAGAAEARALACGLWALAACAPRPADAPAPPRTVAAPAAATPGPTAGRGGPTAAAPAPDLVFPGVEREHAALLEAIETAPPTAFDPVGHTSVVYRMRLVGEVDAAFRPASVRHPRGHLAEVAAYRIARRLGMEHVPPAVSRRVARDDVRRLLRAEKLDRWPELDRETRWDASGHVWGAAIFWIPGLTELGVDEGAAVAGWTAALRHDAAAAPEDAAVLADLSRMVAFDYLIGNVDRFSGGNAKGLLAPRRVTVRDHNLAFLAPLPRPLHERVRRHLGRTERFSRRFVQGLLALDGPRLRAALAEDPGPVPPLDEAQLAGVLDRREALLSYVAALSAAHGEARVLSFP